MCNIQHLSHRIEKLLCKLDPSGRFSSTSGRLSILERFTDSFQVQEREDQSTVRTMWYPVRMRISVRQESQFKMNCPDIWQLWSRRWYIIYGNWRFDFNRPDARVSDMEITCWSLAVWTLLPHGPDAWILLWTLLAADVRPFGRSSHPVRTMFLYRKDFSAKILENPVTQLSIRTAMVHRPDGS
jgi:hypothetical protein